MPSLSYLPTFLRIPLATIDLFVFLLPLTILKPSILSFSVCERPDEPINTAICDKSTLTPIGYIASFCTVIAPGEENIADS